MEKNIGVYISRIISRFFERAQDSRFYYHARYVSIKLEIHHRRVNQHTSFLYYYVYPDLFIYPFYYPFIRVLFVHINVNI